MLTEFLRDQAFAIAWLSMMAAAWFGWGQEDPKPGLRGWLGAGSSIGLVLAAVFGILVARNWNTPTALEGNYWIFGVIVVAEVVLIGGGALVLARRHQQRWYGWWIALCVASHFIPLAGIFDDWSYYALAAVQVVGLMAMLPTLRRGDYPTSRWAAPWIGATFLLFASVSAILFLTKHGFPF